LPCNRGRQRLLRAFFVGDTDEGDASKPVPEFERSPRQILGDMISGGVNLTWNLLVSIAIGISLMFTRLMLGADGAMANADHLIGSLVVTVSVIACAEVARSIRFLNVMLGAAALVIPFVYDTTGPQLFASIACGLALIALALPRGRVHGRYGGWNRYVI
jgi:hypothetical protein